MGGSDEYPATESGWGGGDANGKLAGNEGAASFPEKPARICRRARDERITLMMVERAARNRLLCLTWFLIEWNGCTSHAGISITRSHCELSSRALRICFRHSSTDGCTKPWASIARDVRV